MTCILGFESGNENPDFCGGGGVLALRWGADLVCGSAACQPAQHRKPLRRADTQAEAYFNFMMGHLYEGDFRSTSQKTDADRAVEFYKKAYALNPSSNVIGEQLAEMYFVSQQIGDAIVEAAIRAAARSG